MTETELRAITDLAENNPALAVLVQNVLEQGLKTLELLNTVKEASYAEARKYSAKIDWPAYHNQGGSVQGEQQKELVNEYVAASTAHSACDILMRAIQTNGQGVRY